MDMQLLDAKICAACKSPYMRNTGPANYTIDILLLPQAKLPTHQQQLDARRTAVIKDSIATLAVEAMETADRVWKS